MDCLEKSYIDCLGDDADDDDAGAGPADVVDDDEDWAFRESQQKTRILTDVNSCSLNVCHGFESMNTTDHDYFQPMDDDDDDWFDVYSNHISLELTWDIIDSVYFHHGYNHLMLPPYWYDEANQLLIDRS